MNPLRKFETKLRAVLGRHPVLYAFVGGVGVVLFWRGIWHLNDFFAMLVMAVHDGVTTVDWAPGLDSLISLVLGVGLLLSTGLFVAEFLSGQVLISKVKKEEALTEKAEKEVKEESAELPKLEAQIHHIAQEIKEIEEDVEQQRGPKH